MDSFNVIISPKALSQLNSYIDYLQYTLLNNQAANNVWQKALETREHLSRVASDQYEALKKYSIEYLQHNLSYSYDKSS